MTNKLLKKSSTGRNFFMRMLLLALGGTLSVVAFNHEAMEHLFARLVFFGFTVCMIIEMHRLLPSSIRPRSIVISLFSGLVFPSYALLEAYVWRNIMIPPYAFIILIFFIYSIFTVFNSWDRILYEIISVIFIAIYPGLLASYWLFIPYLDNATLHLFALTGGIFVVDGFSYFVGFGLGRFEAKRRTKQLLSVSPKKTITGFLGGIVFGYAYFLIIYYINPFVFNSSIPKTFLFASIIILAVFLGDLFESAIKRVLNVKDSGRLMLGRGGVLDTFDSILFATPVYVIFYPIIFGL